MRHIFVIFILGIILAACSKTPSHVISENDMVALMADLYKAEAIIDDEDNKTFSTDSMKMKLRQSVFMRHNVTQEQFDTSLIWYAHNLDVYDKVFDDIIARLEDEQKNVTRGDYSSTSIVDASALKPSMPRYRASGDTADIWGKGRVWVMLPGHKQHIVSFDIKPDKEYMRGDKYEIALKAVNVNSTVNVFMAVDYEDGSTSFRQTSFNKEGWQRFKVQSDTAREVKRIHGFMDFATQSHRTLFMDSVELIRTHFDNDGYSSALRQQKWIQDQKIIDEEDKNKKKDKKKSIANERKLSAHDLEK